MIGRRRVLRVLSAAPAIAMGASGACGQTEHANPTAYAEADADASDGARDDAPTCPGIYYGSVEDFPGSTWRLVGVGDDRVIVSRDDSGLYAYSATCTHEKCFIELQDAFGQTRCPCHGATFDGNGLVLSGPATVTLDHYAVLVCGRRVFVDRNQTVPPHTRTVP